MKEANQTSLVVIKPDMISRRLVGVVLSRLESLGLELIGAKVVRVTQAQAEEHYQHIRRKPFFQETVDFMRGKFHGVEGVLVLVFWGPNAIQRIRDMAGVTNPDKAEPASLRAGLGRNTATGLMENVLHASSNPAEAEREVRLWFRSGELTRDCFVLSGKR